MQQQKKVLKASMLSDNGGATKSTGGFNNEDQSVPKGMVIRDYAKEERENGAQAPISSQLGDPPPKRKDIGKSLRNTTANLMDSAEDADGK